MSKALVFREFGEPPQVLALEDWPLPEPATGQVRVRMLASPVNPSDLMNVRGVYGVRPELPAVPGFEGVGVVEACGGGLLGKLMSGKRVVVLNRAGGNWATHALVPAKQVIPVGKTLSDEDAATFFVNPAAALVMTRQVLKIPRDDWLLQTAAASALGRMVIRLGHRFGFHTINIVRRESAAEELKSLGASEVVVFDPMQHDDHVLRERVEAIVGESGLRHAIDPVGGATGSAVIACLGQNARMLVYGTLADEPLAFSSRALMTPAARIEGFWLSNHMNRLSLPARLGLVRSVSKLIAAGVLKTEIGRVFPLSDFREAITHSEETARGGKVLMRIADSQACL